MSSAPYKVLIIGPSWIGDMVMAQSLFMAIKADKPDAIIDVLALAWTKPLLDRMPEVNQAITMPISHGVFGLKMRRKLGKDLRATQYDQAIVLPNSWKSALIPWFANIPLRTGWKGEARYGLLNDLRLLDKTALPLMVQRFVSLAYPTEQAHIAPSYPAPKMVAEPATFDVPTLQAKQKRLILCPGAEFGPAKQWPASSYAEVAQSLLTQDWQVLILGSQADAETGCAIVDAISSEQQAAIHNLCGKTQLEDAIDLLATADIVISNDSGLMHIAAALQMPLIAIYGPTSPNFTPPLSANSQIMQIEVECGPCFQRTCPEQHHKCMKEISGTNVLSLIQKKMSAQSY
jgi:heptosyltransferase-2